MLGVARKLWGRGERGAASGAAARRSCSERRRGQLKEWPIEFEDP